MKFLSIILLLLISLTQVSLSEENIQWLKGSYSKNKGINWPSTIKIYFTDEKSSKHFSSNFLAIKVEYWFYEWQQQDFRGYSPKESVFSIPSLYPEFNLEDEMDWLKDENRREAHEFYLTKLVLSSDQKTIKELNFYILTVSNGSDPKSEKYSFDEPHSYSGADKSWFYIRYYCLRPLQYILLAITVIIMLVELIFKIMKGVTQKHEFTIFLIIYFIFYVFIAIPNVQLSFCNYEVAQQFYYQYDSETAEGMLNRGFWSTITIYIIIWATGFLPVLVVSVIIFPIIFLILFLLWVMYLLPVFALWIPFVLLIAISFFDFVQYQNNRPSIISPFLELAYIVTTGYHLLYSVANMLTSNCPSCQGHIVSLVFYCGIFAILLLFLILAIISFYIRLVISKQVRANMNGNNANQNLNEVRNLQRAGGSGIVYQIELGQDSHILQKKSFIGGSECIICLCELTNARDITKTKCGHYYHNHCIQEWKKKSNTCPLCRKEL